MTLNNNTTQIAGLSLAALLALTACGGNGNGDSANEDDESQDGAEQTAEEPEAAIYEFEEAKSGNNSDSQPFRAPEGQQINIWLSDELAATVPHEVPVLVDSYVITGTRVFESTGVCVIDVEINYTEGGLEALLEEHEEDEITDPLFDASRAEAMVDELPSDEEIMETGVYMTTDHSAASIVDDCEDERFTRFEFPDASGGYFARITRVTVHTDGSVALNQAQVRGASVSANGQWVAEEPADTSGDDSVDDSTEDGVDEGVEEG